MGSIGINGLASAIAKEMEEYRQDATDGLKQEIKKVAKECKNEIQQNAPKLTGDYKKSWRVKEAYESAEGIRVVVHSKNEYRLAHLLEYGHAKRNGGRVEGKPHIQPAEQHAEEKLMKKVKVVIRGGNS